MPIKFLLNGKKIDLTSENITIKSDSFNVDENGNMSCSNANINGGYITLKTTNPNLADSFLKILNNDNINQLLEAGATFMWLTDKDGSSGIRLETNNYTSEGSCLPVIQLLGGDGSFTQISSQSIFSPSISQTSLEEQKKNFEKLDNETALNIVLDTDIYKYNLKSQEDTDKKHLGFVIGDKYKYSKEITSQNNDGVDSYSMISASYGAIQKLYSIMQEQQTIIEQLQKEIKEMKGA